jgi:ABC-type proline/glycine betaine transport system permease subunit
MTLFIVRGPDDTSFDILAAALNSLTILPASILAFWHRRIACVWLTVNAVLLISALGSWTLKTHEYEIGAIIGCSGSVALAIFLDVAEALRWPPALDRTANQEARTNR